MMRMFLKYRVDFMVLTALACAVALLITAGCDFGGGGGGGDNGGLTFADAPQSSAKLVPVSATYVPYSGAYPHFETVGVDSTTGNTVVTSYFMSERTKLTVERKSCSNEENVRWDGSQFIYSGQNDAEQVRGDMPNTLIPTDYVNVEVQDRTEQHPGTGAFHATYVFVHHPNCLSQESFINSRTNRVTAP